MNISPEEYALLQNAPTVQEELQSCLTAAIEERQKCKLQREAISSNLKESLQGIKLTESLNYEGEISTVKLVPDSQGAAQAAQS